MILLLISIIVIIIVFKLLIAKYRTQRFSNTFKYTNYAYMGRNCNTAVVPGIPKPRNKIDVAIHKSDILKMYSDLSYDTINEEELPNGGLLVSMISNNYACNPENKQYEAIIDKNKKCVTEKDCNYRDLKDISKLLTDTANENLTSCYSLDSSYMRTDFPAVLFGPLLDSPLDMNIGIILDIKLIRQYVGCMSIVDSGSVGRYNRIIKNINKNMNREIKGYIPTLLEGNIETTDITDNEVKNQYSKLINSKNGRGLAQAGCGLQTGFQGPGMSGISNDKILPNGKKNKFEGARNVILTKYGTSDGPFSNDDNINEFLTGTWGNNSQTIRRTSWKYFISLIREKVNQIDTFGGNSKLWKKLISNRNFGTHSLTNIYTENEVDIFIPNTDKVKNGGENCDPTDEFKEIWKKAVIGIFTNNRCIQNIKYNKVCDNCNKLQTYDCDSEDSTINCCCNSSLNENIVKKLVSKFNENSENIINGYVMNDNMNPSSNFPSSNKETGLYELKIKQITDYKKYLLG